MANTKVIEQLRAVVGDAYSFVRSYEVNKSIIGVTLEALMEEQIARNGTSEDSSKSKYDPYAATDVSGDVSIPVSDNQLPRNFVSGVESTNPTKMDRLERLKSAINSMVVSVKAYDPADIADSEDYAEVAESTVTGPAGSYED